MRLSKVYLLSAVIALTITAILFILTVFYPFLQYRHPQFKTALLGIPSSLSNSLRLVDVRGRDLFFRIRHNLMSEVPNESKEIVLLNLDDETLEQLNTRWPFPRSLYTEALRRLIPYEPKAIGFDLIFAGEGWDANIDQALADAMKEAGNVIIGQYESKNSEVGPTDVLRKNAARVGRVDKIRDPDSVVRRAYITRGSGEDEERSWELEVYSTAFPDADISKLAAKWPVPINYKLTFNQFKHVPFWKVVKGVALAKDVKNKIILLSLTASAFHDVHSTPLGLMRGVAMNANLLLTLMQDSFFKRVPWAFTLTLSFLSIWFALLVAATSSIGFGVTIVLLLSVLFIVVGYTLFSLGVILDPWLLVAEVITVFIGTNVFRQVQLLFENARLRDESSKDALTGFYNRRYLTLKLKAEFHRIVGGHGFFKTNDEVSVVMIDLDNFKLVNDSFGHAEGDRVLRTLAATIRASVRKEEILCRFGGDEFCVILPGTTIESAVKFANKICKVISSNPDLSYTTKDGTRTIRVTGSLGVASVAGAKAQDPAMLLKAADRALYRAKAGGRNQVCTYDPKRDVIE